MDFAGGAVDDLGRGADIDSHGKDAAALDHHPFDDFGARTDEAIVLDDHGGGLQGLQHAADANAAGEVAVLADLGTGGDRDPGIHHGAAVDPRADIDEARHQDDSRRDIGGVAHDAARHGPESGLAEAVFAPAGEFQRDLVVGPGGDIHRRRIAKAEEEQQRLLQPLVGRPFAVEFLRHAVSARIEARERFFHRELDGAPRGRGDAVALLPGGIDGGLQMFGFHNPYLSWSGCGA